MLENELWASIDGFSSYEISNHGRVRHIDRLDTIKKISVNYLGMPVVVLFSGEGSVRYLRQINKLVATAFIDPVDPEWADAPDRIYVWHIDGDLLNCRANNLRWDTKTRVSEWNRMHRLGVPQFRTPMVKNNATNEIYGNAYECAKAEGFLESHIIWKIERQSSDVFSERAAYRYVTNNHPA